MPTKLRCAIYTRVSTDTQSEIEFNSCESQKEQILSYVGTQNDLEVVRVYSDAGYTGSNLKRPALQNLLHDATGGSIDCVLVYKIDRLTRSPRDFYDLMEYFNTYGISFISTTQRFDTSTATGRLIRNIMLDFAQFEREMTVEVGGRRFVVKLWAPEVVAPATGGRRPPPRRKPPRLSRQTDIADEQGVITAPMQGTIVKVHRRAGEAVERDEALFILEAMKMENEVRAPISGEIVDLRVQAGDKVGNGQVLAIVR